MKLWFMLTEQDKVKLARFYEENFGKKLVLPVRDRHAIHLEAKLEDLEEIAELMKSKPHYEKFPLS